MTTKEKIYFLKLGVIDVEKQIKRLEDKIPIELPLFMLCHNANIYGLKAKKKGYEDWIKQLEES